MAESGSKVIRVFLSSTFVDFQEERSLLVKQVFPSLRRRARSREVEIVDVDLRWGVTEEQTKRGETLPLCLAEIDRCRPYFISLLGERYGWVPPADYYKPELLERQPWLREQMGGASVTELEILHGVLRNPEMAGHACFYLRDPAYAQAQSQPGWVAENPQERQRLVALKEELRRSGFPVMEGLAEPQAIAERIEADLWELIERTFPEQEPPDALEREGRRHADYRRARTGLYLGGETAIAQLEGWLAAGEQRILITGESGAGKSALIANWLEAHQRSHPQDLVHAHHLGCTNEASAVRPLLGRLINTVSQLLAEQPISEPIKVPQDWWELVFKVGEVFALLSALCEKQKCRWILVLDGLDRLAEDDQHALPWIPTTLPPGIHIVASALDCPARSILHEREYLTQTIGPLGESEQQQLMERYLGRYTKQLESGLQQKILAHPLAGSPLFLKVLLEELRQCAGFDTLADQMQFYLSADSIDGLYGKVLERLEKDGHGEATRKALTALWASRAGLSESELCGITGLVPVEWAPVDLALEEALGRNGERLVFGHEFVRRAVEVRYLPSEADQQGAHSVLADWFMAKEEWRAQEAEELPWQLQKADRQEELRKHLMNPSFLASLQSYRGSQEVARFWHLLRQKDGDFLDELIADAVQKEIKIRNNDIEDLIDFLDRLAAVLVDIGLQRELLLNLRSLSVEKEAASKNRDEHLMNESLAFLASVHENMGHFQKAETLYNRVLESRLRLLGAEHPDTLDTVSNLGHLFNNIGDYDKAEAFYNQALEAEERLLGLEHPSTLITVNNLGALYFDMGNYAKAEVLLKRAFETSERLLGPEHPSTLTTVTNIGKLYSSLGDYGKAEVFYNRALEAEERLLGPDHPSTLSTVEGLGGLHDSICDYSKAEALYNRTLESRERLLGPEHPDTLYTVSNLGALYITMGDYAKSEEFSRRVLDAREKLLGHEHPATITSVAILGALYKAMGDYAKAEVFYTRALEAMERLLGLEHPDTLTTVSNLGGLYEEICDYGKAEAFYNRALEAEERLLGPEHPSTLITVNNLGGLYKEIGDYNKAEAFYNRALEAEERLLGPDHPSTLITVNNLGTLYFEMGDYAKAEVLLKRSHEALERLLGPEHPSTLTTLTNIGRLYSSLGDYGKAEVFYNRALEAEERLLGPEHPSTLTTIYHFAELLSVEGRQTKAIPLRRRELAWRRQQNGDQDSSTLLSINQLAIDLRETKELQEAETLFHELVTHRQLVLEPRDFDIGRALGGLAKTLEAAGKLDEALIYARKCLDHRLEHQGTNDFYTNRNRLDLARVLHKLGHFPEASAQLDALLASLRSLEVLNESEQQLQAEAIVLWQLITVMD